MNTVVDRLRQMVIHGGKRAFENVPEYLKTVIEEKLWADCPDEHGIPFKTFEAFVKYKLWWGLESSIDDLLKFSCKRDDVRELIDLETGALAMPGAPEGSQNWKGKGKGHNGSDPIVMSDNKGRGSTYILKRLKRDHPDLAERVVSGELSAHAASIEAGFNRKMIQVPADDLRAAIAKLERHYGVSIPKIRRL